MIASSVDSWRRVPRWMIAVSDQGLVAVVNLLLSIAVTQVAGVAVLGRFAIISTTILLALGFTRLLITDPWLASRKAPVRPDRELIWLVAVAAAVTVGVVAVVVALGSGGDARWFLACGVAPLVIVQDFGRYVAFRREGPARAFMSDASVLLVGTGVFAVASVLGSVGLTGVLLCWMIGLLSGALVVRPRLLAGMSPRGSARWWHTFCRPLATKLALDGVAFLLAVNGSLYLLAYLGTQEDVGLVRIVQTMFSPATLTVTGLTMWLIPMLANRDATRAVEIRRRVTWLLAIGSVPLVALAVVVGPTFARLVFGVSEAPSPLSLCFAAASACLLAVAAPWVASARVSGRYSPIAWTRGLSAVITWGGMILLPALRGTTGYLALLALQSAMIAAAAIAIGLHESHDPRPRLEPSEVL